MLNVTTLDVVGSNFSCECQQTWFSFTFPNENSIIVKKGKIIDSFRGKVTYLIVIFIKKLHIRHYCGYLEFSSGFPVIPALLKFEDG